MSTAQTAARCTGWRVLGAAPAMIGSLLLLVFLTGGLQPWGALVALAWLGITVFTIAIGQGIHEHQWGSVAVLASVAISVLAAPVIDAGASRAGEYEADQFVAQTGYGDDLSRALTDTDSAAGILSLRSRMLSRHPGTARRVQRLHQTCETLTRSI